MSPQATAVAGKIGTISIYKLECKEQTGPGEDQIWLEIKGTREWPASPTDPSGREQFSYRLPGPDPKDVWELSDEEGENRVVKEITVFQAPLHDTEVVEASVKVWEGTHIDGSLESPGAIKVFLKRENGVDIIRGEPYSADVVGGCVTNGDPEFPQMQRFDLKGDDSHYIIFLRAPGTCP